MTTDRPRRGERCLVTGGAGFIGSHVTERLLREGSEVLVVDDLSSGSLANISSALDDGANLESADVTDGPSLRAIFEKFRPDVVFHLAAQIHVSRSVQDPAFDAAVNVVGTVALLEEAYRFGARQFVFTSSGGAIYGEARGGDLPLSEECAVGALSPYGQSKVAAETYLDLYARTRGLKSVSLRLANVYGPRQGQQGEAGVVAVFSQRIAAGLPLRIFGDGEQTRDYVFVGDVVDACVRASRTELSGAFNIGTGRQTSVNRLVELMGQISRQSGIEVSYQPEREGEVRSSALDSSKARDALGWQPEVELRDGMAITLEAAGN